ncbi:hypothetical protein INR49_017533 [Caranx melampygus]|nr:hypothetical protein INR49_017533 [Caranx melampygus]
MGAATQLERGMEAETQPERFEAVAQLERGIRDVETATQLERGTEIAATQDVEAAAQLKKGMGAVTQPEVVEAVAQLERDVGCRPVEQSAPPPPPAAASFRPAPFFVLDEVDAALDNTNISKVTSFIREESRENVQIIVISQKEEFFSKADALLGVYSDYDERMFSCILSLDLRPYPLVEEDNGKLTDRPRDQYLRKCSLVMINSQSFSCVVEH